MKFELKVYSILEYGQRVDAQGNPHQEDSIYPQLGKQSDADRLFVLCDGMGGHDAGEVASSTVCEAMSASVLANPLCDGGQFGEDVFQQALAVAFEALDAKDTGADKKMGTTMTFLKLHNDGATIAHMGDSRVYHIRPGETPAETQILFQTIDHSLVNDLVKIGEMTPEEARTSKQRNVITRAMQPCMDRRPKADVHQVSDIRPNDYFMLCSDGMLEQMDDENLCYIFSKKGGDAIRKVELLTKLTSENKDNHSAILVHILDVYDAVMPVSLTQADEIQQSMQRKTPIVPTKERRIIKKQISHGSDLRTWILAMVALLGVIIWLNIDKCSNRLGTQKVEKPAEKEGRSLSTPLHPANPTTDNGTVQPLTGTSSQASVNIVAEHPVSPVDSGGITDPSVTQPNAGQPASYICPASEQYQSSREENSQQHVSSDIDKQNEIFQSMRNN